MATNTAPLIRAGHQPGNYNEFFGLLWSEEVILGAGSLLVDDEIDFLVDDEGDHLTF